MVWGINVIQLSTFEMQKCQHFVVWNLKKYFMIWGVEKNRLMLSHYLDFKCKMIFLQLSRWYIILLFVVICGEGFMCVCELGFVGLYADHEIWCQRKITSSPLCKSICELHKSRVKTYKKHTLVCVHWGARMEAKLDRCLHLVWMDKLWHTISVCKLRVITSRLNYTILSHFKCYIML